MSATTLCSCAASDCGGACGATGPDPIGNPARVGQPVLLAAMRTALSGDGRCAPGGGADGGALDRLTTRDPDDVAMALADAYASALSVLGFATARIAEDGAIAVSQDRGALVDLTALIGYVPRPAIAAATTLAFQLDTTPGAPAQATIPAGTRVATLPRDGAPQVPFETGEALIARGAWNRLVARRAVSVPPIRTGVAAHGGALSVQRKDHDGARNGLGEALAPVEWAPHMVGRRKGGSAPGQTPQAPPASFPKTLTVAGTDLRAAVGDAILVGADDGGWMFARVAHVERVAAPPVPADPVDPAAPQARTVLTLTDARAVFDGKGPTRSDGVLLLGQRAAAFGASAPLSFPKDATTGSEWTGLTLPGDGTVDLEGTIKDAIVGRTVLFAAGETRAVGTITATTDAHRTGFNLSMAVTKIKVDGIALDGQAGDAFHNAVRALTLYIETQRAPLLALPEPGETLPKDATPQILPVLGTAAADLPAGRTVAVRGTTPGGASVTELATIATASASGGGTVLTLTGGLATRFLADGLVVFANVVDATQGTRILNPPEILGSSSAARDAPTYPLSATPVAHVPADGPLGYAPAVAVAVGGRRYDRQERFLDLADDRAWRLRPRRDGKFEVQFAGRLPTGSSNVTADYRVGGGASGNVAAGAVTMVLTPVVGVNGVQNVLLADGGSDAAPADAMRAAGETITVLDRVVSLHDHARFARTYRGVGRAMATELRVAMRREVVLTIASDDPANPQPSAALRAALGRAIADASAPGRAPMILGFTDLPVAATIALATDPALDRATVEHAVRTALVAALGPDARGFGEPLWASQVTALVQRVPGVVATRVALDSAVDPIVAAGPRAENGAIVPAIRVALDPAAIAIEALVA